MDYLVNVEVLSRAFTRWETLRRKNPDNFLDSNDVSAMTPSEVGKASAENLIIMIDETSGDERFSVKAQS